MAKDKDIPLNMAVHGFNEAAKLLADDLFQSVDWNKVANNFAVEMCRGQLRPGDVFNESRREEVVAACTAKALRHFKRHVEDMARQAFTKAEICNISADEVKNS